MSMIILILLLACFVHISLACEWYEGEGEFLHIDFNRGLYTRILGANTLESCSEACCERSWCIDLSFYASNNECILYVRDPDTEVPLYCDTPNLNISECGGTPGLFVRKTGVISRTRVRLPLNHYNNPYNQTNVNSFGLDFIGKGKCVNTRIPEGELGYHHDFIFEKNHGKENCINLLDKYGSDWQSWANYIEEDDHAICRMFFRSFNDFSEETSIATINKRELSIDCDLDVCQDWLAGRDNADENGKTYDLELVETDNDNDWCVMFRSMGVFTDIECNNPFYNNETYIDGVCIKVDAKCEIPDDVTTTAIKIVVNFEFFTDMSFYCVTLCDRNPEWCLGYNLFNNDFKCEFITTREVFYKPGTETQLYDVDLSGQNIDFSIDFSEFHYCSQFNDNLCSKSIEPFYYQRTNNAVCGIIQNNCSVFEYFPSIQGKCSGEYYPYNHEYLIFHNNAVPSISNFCRNMCCNIEWCDAYEIDSRNCYFYGSEMPDDQIVEVGDISLLKQKRDFLELDKDRSCVAKLSSREQTCPTKLVRFEGKDIFRIGNIHTELPDIITEEECVNMCCKHSFWCQAATFDSSCTLYTKYSSLDRYTIMDDKTEETFQESFLGDVFSFDCNGFPCRNHSRNYFEDYKLVTKFSEGTTTTFMDGDYEFNVWDKFVKIDDDHYFDGFTEIDFVDNGETKEKCFQHATAKINTNTIFDLSIEDFVVVFKEDEIDQTLRCMIARLSSFVGNAGVINVNNPGAAMSTVPFLENLDITCPTQTDTSYCISEESKCQSEYGNAHFVTLPIIETNDIHYAKTLCFDMCKKNKLWCQGIDFDIDTFSCKLLTSETIFFEPGVDGDVPLYTIYDEYQISDSPICEFRKDYPSCDEVDIFPIVLGDLQDNICAISISGTCDADLRRHFQGHCYGKNFKDYVYTLKTLTDDNEMISVCKQICCDASWCNALEVLFEKEVGHECIFMIDDSNPNPPLNVSVEVGDLSLLRNDRVLNQDVELGRLCFAYDYAIETSLHPDIPMVVVGDACGKYDGSFVFSLGKTRIDHEPDDDTLEWCYQKCQSFGSACTGIEHIRNSFKFDCFILTDMVSLHSFQKETFQRVINAINNEASSISVDIGGDIFTASVDLDTILKDSSDITAWSTSDYTDHHFFDEGRNDPSDRATCMTFRSKEYNYLENKDLTNDQLGDCPVDESFFLHKFKYSIEENHCAKLCHHENEICKAYSFDNTLCKIWVDTSHPNFNIFSWDENGNFVQLQGNTFSETCENDNPCQRGDRNQYNTVENRNTCILNSNYEPYRDIVVRSYEINPLFVGLSVLIVILLIVFNRQVNPPEYMLSSSRYIIGIIIVVNIFYITFIVNNTTVLGAKVMTIFSFVFSGLIFMTFGLYSLYFEIPSKANVVFGLLTLSMFNLWIGLDYYSELKLEQIILLILTVSCLLLILHLYFFNLMGEYLSYILPFIMFLIVLVDVSYSMYEFVNLSLTVSISIGVGTLSLVLCCGCVCLANMIEDE